MNLSSAFNLNGNSLSVIYYPMKDDISSLAIYDGLFSSNCFVGSEVMAMT